MVTLVGIFAGFILLIAMVAMNHHSSTGYTEKIQALKARKQSLQIKITDLNRAIKDLKESELHLSSRVDDIKGSAHYAELASGKDLITGVAKSKRKVTTGAHNTIVDVLLAEKLLKPEELAKAEVYKEQSQSPYSIAEVLTLLGYVSNDVIERVKRRYPNIK